MKMSIFWIVVYFLALVIGWDDYSKLVLVAISVGFGIEISMFGYKLAYRKY